MVHHAEMALQFRVSLRLSFPAQRRSIASSTNQNLFSYTSGRFIYNEELRLRGRYVKFNPDALLREAERVLGAKHGSPTGIIKLAEGGFNRVFLLTMSDGFEAIMKMLYHHDGPKYYATASEAATLQYLHSKGIPVPKLYGYSASASNEVGVEYIIMEKAPGTGLQSLWVDMSKRQRHKLASSFVEIEKKLFDLSLGCIGSIYFKKDIPSDLQATLYSTDSEKDQDSDSFCIGPTADYMFWHRGRDALDLYRGPCGYIWPPYLQAVAQKEIAWIEQYGKPLELDFPHNGAFPGEKHPKEYLHLLEKYLALVPYLLPQNSNSPLNRPTLRHPDLNPNNIFISPDSGAVTCIIDWQYTTTEPRLLAAGYPATFKSPDSEPLKKLIEPTLPPEYDSLPLDQKAEADELHRRRLTFYYYHIFNGHLNKSHLQALRDPLVLLRQYLVDRAGGQWSGDLMALKGTLVRMVEYWPLLSGTAGIPCPVQFSDAEMDGFAEQEQMWHSLNKLVAQWYDQVGVSEDGWVSNEQYGEAMRKVGGLKASFVELADGDEGELHLLEKGWLFRDREEGF
ncbi:kinase-like domain-containing protein [Aspergillus varians]